ncbi:hypothetical protein JX266_004587 [Neoarthrinium moseri]|nr:hypothetical protein JX266_004587 [Neoarthrinium moseri]
MVVQLRDFRWLSRSHLSRKSLISRGRQYSAASKRSPSNHQLSDNGQASQPANQILSNCGLHATQTDLAHKELAAAVLAHIVHATRRAAVLSVEPGPARDAAIALGVGVLAAALVGEGDELATRRAVVLRPASIAVEVGQTGDAQLRQAFAEPAYGWLGYWLPLW